MKTKPLSCRVPVTTYEAIKAHCGGPKALGSFVAQAVAGYLDQPNIVAKAVLKALREEEALRK